jgi:hypothetical protein
MFGCVSSFCGGSLRYQCGVSCIFCTIGEPFVRGFLTFDTAQRRVPNFVRRISIQFLYITDISLIYFIFY